jgi:hypothetical protein
MPTVAQPPPEARSLPSPLALSEVFAPADQPNDGGNRDCRGSLSSAILACRFAMTFVSGDGRIDCHSVSSKQEELSP